MRPPQSWHQARATLAISIVTAAAWLLAVFSGQENAAAVYAGFIPARVGTEIAGASLVPVFLTPLTATLVHGGAVHLFFNMLIHLYCGRAVETILGTRQFLILYVAAAYVAAAAHYLVDPASLVPMIGASGAISGVIGGFAAMFGRNRVKIADPRLAMIVNALWLAAAWVVLQVLIGVTFRTAGAQIAVAAHIGGFFAGLVLAKPLLLLRYRGA